MIKSFANKQSEYVWVGERIKKPSLQVQHYTRRKLRMLNNAQDVTDLRIAPANSLEKLSGNLKRFHSIRINKQWRIIFVWKDGNAFEVEICGYH
jgi:proteic killer suppression protein